MALNRLEPIEHYITLFGVSHSAKSLENLQLAITKYRDIRDLRQLEADAANLSFSQGVQAVQVYEEELSEQRKRQRREGVEEKIIEVKEEIEEKAKEYEIAGNGVSILDRLFKHKKESNNLCCGALILSCFSSNLSSGSI